MSPEIVINNAPNNYKPSLKFGDINGNGRIDSPEEAEKSAKNFCDMNAVECEDFLEYLEKKGFSSLQHILINTDEPFQKTQEAISALGDESEIIRKQALLTLQHLAAVIISPGLAIKLVDALLEALKSNSYRIQEGAAEALGKIIGIKGFPSELKLKMIAPLIMALGAHSLHVQNKAIEALVILGESDIPKENLINALLKDMLEQNNPFWEATVKVLVGLAGSKMSSESKMEIVDCLIEKLRDENRDILKRVGKTLVALFESDAPKGLKMRVVNSLINVLSEENTYETVKESLGCIEDYDNYMRRVKKCYTKTYEKVKIDWTEAKSKAQGILVDLALSKASLEWKLELTDTLCGKLREDNKAATKIADVLIDIAKSSVPRELKIKLIKPLIMISGYKDQYRYKSERKCGVKGAYELFEEYDSPFSMDRECRTETYKVLEVDWGWMPNRADLVLIAYAESNISPELIIDTIIENLSTVKDEMMRGQVLIELVNSKHVSFALKSRMVTALVDSLKGCHNENEAVVLLKRLATLEEASPELRSLLVEKLIEVFMEGESSSPAPILASLLKSDIPLHLRKKIKEAFLLILRNKNAHRYVRLETIKAIENLDKAEISAEAIRLLVDALGDKEQVLREETAKALVKLIKQDANLGIQIVDAAIKNLRVKDKDFCEGAVELFAMISEGKEVSEKVKVKTIDPLIVALSNKDEEIRKKAAEVLARLIGLDLDYKLKLKIAEALKKAAAEERKGGGLKGTVGYYTAQAMFSMARSNIPPLSKLEYLIYVMNFDPEWYKGEQQIAGERTIELFRSLGSSETQETQRQLLEKLILELKKGSRVKMVLLKLAEIDTAPVLVDLLIKKPGEEAADLLVSLANNQKLAPELRVKIILRLFERSPANKATQALLFETTLDLAEANALLRRGLIDPLLVLLLKGDEKIRLRVADIMVGLVRLDLPSKEKEKMVAPLLKALEDKNREVRMTAVLALNYLLEADIEEGLKDQIKKALGKK